MSLARQMCRSCVALAGVVVLSTGAVTAENKPKPTASQPSAHVLSQPTHMKTTITLPNGLTFGCVVPVPPEPVAAQATNKRYIPPPDPIPPCLSPEQRAAHEKVNAALQHLRDLQRPTNPQQVKLPGDSSNQPKRERAMRIQTIREPSIAVAGEIRGGSEFLGSLVEQQGVPVPTAFAAPRIPDAHSFVPAPSPNLHRTSGPATNLPPEVQATYDAANQLTQFNSTTANVTHDANGNLTSIMDITGTTTFTYDARNRLIARNGPGVNETYIYDALGRRITKTTNGATKNYLYDGNDVVAEVQGGAVSATYLRGLNIDEPFVRQSASGNEQYHADAQRSTLSLTDAAGFVRTSYSYDAYGNTMVTGIVSANPFQYTGRENDGDGLYYYRARYYSPQIQRFFSEDPISYQAFQVIRQDVSDLDAESGYQLLLANPMTWHRYNYVENNPLTRIDPHGFWYVDVGGGAALPLVPGGVGGTFGVQVGPDGVFVTGGTGFGIGGATSATINSGSPTQGISSKITMQGGNGAIGVKATYTINQNGSTSTSAGIGFGVGANVSYTPVNQTVCIAFCRDNKRKISKSER